MIFLNAICDIRPCITKNPFFQLNGANLLKENLARKIRHRLDTRSGETKTECFLPHNLPRRSNAEKRSDEDVESCLVTTNSDSLQRGARRVTLVSSLPKLSPRLPRGTVQPPKSETSRDALGYSPGAMMSDLRQKLLEKRTASAGKLSVQISNSAGRNLLPRGSVCYRGRDVRNVKSTTDHEQTQPSSDLQRPSLLGDRPLFVKKQSAPTSNRPTYNSEQKFHGPLHSGSGGFPLSASKNENSSVSCFFYSPKFIFLHQCSSTFL